MNQHRLETGQHPRTIVYLVLSAALLTTMGCHTAEGIKQDTKNALHATGRGLQRGADKIDGPKQNESTEEDKKDSHPPE